MELTPHSLRSPVSPFDQQSKPQQQYSSQRPYYPTTPQSDSATPRTSQNRGLGVYGCGPLPQSTLHEMPPSPQPSGSWPHASMMEHEFPQSSQPPDIFTAAYDPFSGFSSHSNTGMPPGPSPEAPGLVYCHSPNSNLPSHRSSVSSSFSPSDSFSQNGSDFLYTPKVKMEEAGDWYPSPAHDHGLIPHELSPYSQHVSPVSAPAEEIYRSQQMDWSRPEVPGYPIALQNTDEHRLPKFDSGPILASVTRIKKKRQRTTPEEATHECRVCGKLFKRSYNWKSHMQTHNPKRDYPHPCKAMVGNVQCTKKFQRKTDLERHNDSVHLKAKNYQCTLCGHRFARRDTLRRHTEDGCPKRFELGFREGSDASPGRWSLPNMPARHRLYNLAVPHSSPMASSASNTFAGYNRSELASPTPHISSGFRS